MVRRRVNIGETIKQQVRKILCKKALGNLMPLLIFLIMVEFRGNMASLLQNLWRLYTVMVDCSFNLCYNYYVL